MTSHKTFNCFGLVIQGYDWHDIQNRIKQYLIDRSSVDVAGYRETRPFWIVTANPEILLYAKQHAWYWEIIRQADLRIVDGFGLYIIGLFTGAKPQRLQGVKLADHLLELAVQNKWSVGIAGGKDQNVDKAIWNIRKQHQSLKIIAIPLGEVTPQGQAEFSGNLNTDLLLVPLGHPKQEAWIAKHLNEMTSVKVVIGIGGTVDFWSRETKRAPNLFQKLGLEWFWRLAQEPKRWKRILNAVIIFPLTFLKSKFQN